MAMRLACLCLISWLSLGPVAASAQNPEKTPPPPAQRSVDFVKDIAPILTERCLSCHGAEKQKGGLALHEQAKAMTGGDSGVVILPGKSEESLLIEYVAGLDPDVRMPPKEAGPMLSAEQVGVLRAWIDQGAKWDSSVKLANTRTNAKSHWSFQKPVPPYRPKISEAEWVKTPIDAFVMARLDQERRQHAPEADRLQLLRRVSLDLTGLIPTIEEADAFLKDDQPGAYERLVDRLLASPAYGERWARHWLDRARYADTNGYEKDRNRIIWPYRDWVIQAFNKNMPFDQFTIEQIAGDLLPQATLSQKIATGFHRNTMTNEEGGIDVEEFRFASLVDRVATTSTVWLGLTIGCAQCHTHKYDPITQREYYQLMAFLDNADEPEIDAIDLAIATQRAATEAKIHALEQSLESRFPVSDDAQSWTILKPQAAKAQSGANLTIQPDGSILASGKNDLKDVYEIDLDLDQVQELRLEALVDSSLPATGPGRTPHGNFVVSGFHLNIDGQRAKFSDARADVFQNRFHPSGALDDNAETGWAIDDGSGKINQNRTAVFTLQTQVSSRGAKLVIEQLFGSHHTLGKFRLSARKRDASQATEQQRQKALQTKLDQWAEQTRTKSYDWTVIRPSKVVSKNHATMIVLDDNSVLAAGDKPNNDSYTVELDIPKPGATAIRLEVLTDPSLPDGGPGRAPLFSVGDFLLTEFKVVGPNGPIKLHNASEDYAEPGKPAKLAIDGIEDTGWAVKGKIGQDHAAVFEFAKPLPAGKLTLTLDQIYIHQMTIGRFRVSTTQSTKVVKASGLPADIEAILVKNQPTDAEKARLKTHFLRTTPELAAVHQEIHALRTSMPKHPTTMVMEERKPEYARTTRIHHRGEFLSPRDPVEPAVPAVLHPLPPGVKRDRLALAKWLVDGNNPLTARVVVNQIWQAYFGRGLVRTAEDFGTRGALPTHPELLDWLATEFQKTWDLKKLHRTIVLSATYRQDSKVSSELLALDPNNELLARGPRFRVEAEVVRDLALTASGLLSRKVGGPSVFPPQPDGVTSFAYGQSAWTTSEGPDRYRRGLYTFIKRTAPYAAFTTFDMPTSEVSCVRRERSNTPLQALTLLNDTVFVEAARALGKSVATSSTSDQERVVLAFRRCLTREPNATERDSLLKYLSRQRDWFAKHTEDAGKLAGSLDNAIELASWTSLARVLLNLDETVTKE